MRTTVDLQDNLYRKAKAAASLRGVTFKFFLTQLIEQALSKTTTQSTQRKQVNLPLVKSKKPGSVRLTGKQIADLLDQ